jgi:hypothetical protein
MTLLNALVRQIRARFGQCTLEAFDGSWRVSMPHWHYEEGAVSGSPSGHGRTAEEACVALIRHASRPGVHIGPGRRCARCRPDDGLL